MSRLPPAQRLPLAVRKNVKEKFEVNVDGWESKLSDILGESWSIDFDPLRIFPYATDNFTREGLGRVLALYAEHAIQGLESFAKQYGDDGRKELNDGCAAHALTLDVDASGTVADHGVDVHDGELRILFREGGLGRNVHKVMAGGAGIVKAIEKASGGASGSAAADADGDGAELSLVAKKSVSGKWEPGAEALRAKFAAMLAREDVVLSPGFEKVWGKLLAEKDGISGWAIKEAGLGNVMKLYFEQLYNQMNGAGFGRDEMLREAFNEAVTSGEIAFRLVDEVSNTRSVSEVAIEDGVLYIQTVPTNWSVNIMKMDKNLMDLL